MALKIQVVMQRIHHRIGAAIAFASCASGCATQNVSNPSNITLAHALADTADALAEAHRESIRQGTHVGLYACTVTAVFNISATAGQDNKLSVSAAPPVNIFPLGGALSFDSTATGTRANTVTVVLASKACTAAASGGGANGAAGKGGKKCGGNGGNVFDVPPLLQQKKPDDL